MQIKNIVNLILLILSVTILGTAQTYAGKPTKPDKDKDEIIESSHTYYTVRQDYRDCLPPQCGGVFVSEVNQTATRCADDTLQNECYVSDINWAASGLSESQATEIENMSGVLLRGTIAADYTDSFGILGTFNATEAWTAASTQQPTGTFVRLTNSGIVCVTTPCASTREDILNSNDSKNIHEVDLSNVGATEKQITDAFNAIGSSSDGILAAGSNKYTRAKGKKGTITYLASQFYFRVQPDTVVNLGNLGGRVTLSPTCGGPVILGQVCEEPYVGVQVQILDSSNDLHANTITDADGMFSVKVKAGYYLVRILSLIVDPTPIPLPYPYEEPASTETTGDGESEGEALIYPIYPICPDTYVTVPENGDVKVSIVCDTGIR